jgi:hypothetical protein
MQKQRTSFHHSFAVFLVLFQRRFPFVRAETDQHLVLQHQDGSFDQHAVAGQQMELFRLRHLRQFILKLQITVHQTAGVEKALERQTAELQPNGKLRRCRIVLRDTAGRERDVVRFQPFLRVLASGAFWIMQEECGHKNDFLSDHETVAPPKRLGEPLFFFSIAQLESCNNTFFVNKSDIFTKWFDNFCRKFRFRTVDLPHRSGYNKRKRMDKNRRRQKWKRSKSLR